MKVLDFGLAKTMAIGLEGDLTQLPSGSPDGTAEGRILGTPAYMSPEQARGQAVDKRTDIWAFGCVLFEMLASHRAFDGETVTDMFARILDHEPEWTALPAETPASIRRLLERCLRKDPRKRLHDIADALLEIDDGARPIVSTSAAAVLPRLTPQRVAWIGAALLAGVMLGAGVLGLLRQRLGPNTGGSIELAMTPPTGTRFAGRRLSFSLAPDGRHMAIVAITGNAPPTLWIRPVGSGEAARPLPGTEGAESPFWSPDSRQVAFIANDKLKTVAVAGGEPFEVCDAIGGTLGGGGSWNRDGIIVFASRARHLQKVSATGGTLTPVTTLQASETSHKWPWFLPDGQHFLFLASGQGPPQLRVGSLASADSTTLGAIRTSAVYASGHLLFVNDTLMAQPFDLRSRQLTGDPIPLNARVEVRGADASLISLTVSDTGLLAYRDRQRVESRLTWMDRKGNAIGSAGEPGSYPNLSLSPDDRYVAVAKGGPDGNYDIWVIDLARDRGHHTDHLGCGSGIRPDLVAT